MFEDDEDFEIDEQFLDGVFDAEKSAISNDVSLEISRDCSVGNLDSESSPAKKRRLSSSPVPPLHQEPAPARRTSEETARLVAAANLGGVPPPRVPGNVDQSDFNTNQGDKSKFAVSTNSDNNLSQIHSDEFFKPASKSRNSLELQSHLPARSPNISDVSFTMNTSRIRQRKFPGPAGLLPERGRTHIQGQRPTFSSLLNISGSDLDEAEDSFSFCSQTTASVLEDGPWGMLQSDLVPEGQELLRHYTVAWVKQKAAAKQLVGQKVPFLAAVLNSIDCSSPDPCVVLRDETGEIPGTLHRSVWDTFGGQLVVGSALVLRLVGVLSTGISARRHYLNITANNIVTIYSSPLCESSVTGKLRARKTDVHKWTINQLLQTAKNWEDQSKKTKDNEAPPRTYHPTSSNNFCPSSRHEYSSNTRPLLQNSNRSSSVPNSSSLLASTAANLTGAPSVFRPPQPLNRSNTSSVLHSNPRDLNHDLLHVEPQMQTQNRNGLNSLLPQNIAHVRQTSVTKPIPPVGNNSSAGQSKFVLKRPSLSVGGAQTSNSCSGNAQKLGTSGSTSTSSINLEPSQPAANLQGSLDLFSDGDDFDVSSVLDGIDSESLFGDF